MVSKNEKDSETVKVIVRCRPFSQKEKQAGHSDIVQVQTDQAKILVTSPTNKSQQDPKSFTFDSVFGSDCKQIDVYNTTARPIVESVLNGYNGTIFAYGQTGTGKTFSMEGIRDNIDLKGIIPNSIDHVFSHIKQSTGVNFLVRASYLEIYNEDIRDLLNLKAGKLDLKESTEQGVYVKNLQTVVIKDAAEMDKLMAFGNKNRSVGATLMNETSSRSHSIFTLTVEASEKDEAGEEHIRVGKLNLVDLAGSERQTKTGASGDRLKEASKINLSLSALGNVISALVDGKSTHIPYRDSKLTRLLQDSLGGNARTLMIATLSPASYNYEETISTLRYANRAKNIKNKPTINEDPKDAMLRELQEEIQMLKAQLENGGGSFGDPLRPQSVSPRKQARPKSRISEQELEAMQSQYAQDRLNILSNQDLEDSEKKKLLSDINDKSLEIQKEQEARQALANKLTMLQDQMLGGDVNLMDKEEMQREELADKAAQLEIQRRKERDLVRLLEESDSSKLVLAGSYANLQEEIIEKTTKLKKLWTLFTRAKAEISDLREENQREREDLLDTIRAITREIKLCKLIIDQFIPSQHYTTIEQLAYYDDNTESWNIENIHFAGNNVKGKSALLSDQISVMRGSARQGQIGASAQSRNVRKEGWSPLCMFDNVYMTYDDTKLNDKVSRAQSSRSVSLSPVKSQRPMSASRQRPDSRAASSSPDKRLQRDTSTPKARGLISKPVRY